MPPQTHVLKFESEVGGDVLLIDTREHIFPRLKGADSISPRKNSGTVWRASIVNRLDEPQKAKRTSDRFCSAFYVPEHFRCGS